MTQKKNKSPKKRKQPSKKSKLSGVFNRRSAMFAIGWFAAGVVFITFLSTTHARSDDFVCSDLSVNIEQTSEVGFLREAEILAIAEKNIQRNENGERLVKNIELRQIEGDLISHPYVKAVESHIDLQGRLYLNVKQHYPVARIFLAKGESYYINELGNLMPVPEEGAARVIVLEGNMLDGDLLLPQYFTMVERINANPFLKAMIESVSLNKHEELSVVTKLGNQKVLLGSASNISEKLQRLELYYKKALAATEWSECKVLNLEFKNQIICSK